MVRRRLRFREDQFVNRVTRTGNLASASIPLLIDQLRREGQLKQPRRTLLLGTSAGYAQAGMILNL
jgi:3-oxoacyl-[acyl-carrier-protein] synthase III